MKDHVALVTSVVPEPSTYNDIGSMPSIEREKWLDSMQLELTTFVEKGVFRVVSSIPSGRKTIGLKFVFKVKYNPDGSVERYKTRLVAQGFSQRDGVDYFETYSPTVKFESARIIISLACCNDWELDQVDIKVAYPNAQMDAQIYCRAPPSFVIFADCSGRQISLVPVGRASDLQANGWMKVPAMELCKALYGLKQAGRQWYTPTTELGSQEQTLASSSRGLKAAQRWSSQHTSAISSLQERSRQSKSSSYACHLASSSSLQGYLGVAVSRYRAKGTITLSQRKYIEDTLKVFKLTKLNSSVTPGDVNLSLTSPAEPVDLSLLKRLEQRTPYRKAVGMLHHAARGTRPDIAFITGQLSRALDKPTPAHYHAVIRVLRYLQGSKDIGFTYCKSSGHCNTLTAFSDASWATCIETRKSTTGYVILLNGGAVHWRSHRQRIVTLSSTEAEYAAANEVTVQVVWIRRLLNELGFPDSSPTTRSSKTIQPVYS
jgi:hypothetical protein